MYTSMYIFGFMKMLNFNLPIVFTIVRCDFRLSQRLYNGIVFVMERRRRQTSCRDKKEFIVGYSFVRSFSWFWFSLCIFGLFHLLTLCAPCSVLHISTSFCTCVCYVGCYSLSVSDAHSFWTIWENIRSMNGPNGMIWETIMFLMPWILHLKWAHAQQQQR